MKKGLPFRSVIIICCSLTLIFCAAVRAGEKNKSLTENDLKGIKKIAIVIEEKRPNFEVLHWRAKTAYGTASLLGGFEGDAIAHGIDKGKDANEASLMNPGDIKCSAVFKESLEPLNNSKRFEKVYIASGENKKGLSDYDAVLTFTVNRWGLRLVERENEKLAAFVELKAEMVKAGEKKPVWDERQVIVGNNRRTVAEFTADSNMLNSELKDTIKKAGVQMSNALIYPPAAPQEKPKSKEKVKTGKVTALEINNSFDFKLGALSTIKPLKIEIGTFTDNRQIKDRIGDLRNGFGGKAGMINTARPAPEIVAEAISGIFTKNGHIISTGEKDIVISGSIETYWFESQLRMSSWELMGTVDVNMVVQNSHGKTLFTRRYLGHNNKVMGVFWPKNIIEIMDAAMQNLTDQIPLDTQLIDAIKDIRK
jgi:hypothetical protein